MSHLLCLWDQIEGDRADQGTGTEAGHPTDHFGRRAHPIDGKTRQKERGLSQTAERKGLQTLHVGIQLLN
jgi:hypothetical protein